ncbi:hypothetical protein H3C70_04910 [Patescibacteria group bacterium]|nr:hypothetical protein [Patescibacteria group bacterium]
MTSKQYFFYLRWALRAATVFMVGEALYHASGVRTAGVETIWPQSAVSFTHLFVMLWASISLLVAAVLFYLQKYLEQAKPLLVILTVPCVIHALLLLWLSLTPYTQILPLANLYAWVPFYEVWIRGEAAVLLIYVAYIVYGRWKKYV